MQQASCVFLQEKQTQCIPCGYLLQKIYKGQSYVCSGLSIYLTYYELETYENIWKIPIQDFILKEINAR